MILEFKSRVAVVTGGFRGNGKAIVEKFIASGCRVYSLDCLYKKNKISKNLNQIKVDINNLTSLKKVITKIAKKEKKIDFLINNAGITLKYNFKNHLSYWSKTIHTNLTVPFYLSSICFNYLIKSNYPSIVNISSISSKIAMSNNPAYNASKGGLNSLTMSLAYDYSDYGVRVNAVCPGYIKTNMTKKSFASKKLYNKRVSRMIIRNYGEPSDVANIAFFLCSKNSRYINAEEIVVDGGLIKKGI